MHHIVLPWQDSAPLLAVPEIACFASGARAGPRGDEELCDRVAVALAQESTEARKVVAAALAWRAGRYKTTIKAMENQRVKPPVMIEEIFLAGVEEGEAKGTAEGVLRGKAGALVTLLEARGVSLDEDGRARIEACRDSAVLDRWIAQAAIAKTLGDALS